MKKKFGYFENKNGYKHIALAARWAELEIREIIP